MIKTTCRLFLPLSLSLAFSASGAVTMQQEQSQTRLSSGYRVNSAKDDAAGMKIDSEKEREAAREREAAKEKEAKAAKEKEAQAAKEKEAAGETDAQSKEVQEKEAKEKEAAQTKEAQAREMEAKAAKEKEAARAQEAQAAEVDAREPDEKEAAQSKEAQAKEEEAKADKEKEAVRAKEAQAKEVQAKEAEVGEAATKEKIEAEKAREAEAGKETADKEKAAEMEKRNGGLSDYLRSLERGGLLTESQAGILGKEVTKLSGEELAAAREKLAGMEKLSASLFEASSMKLDINDSERVQVDLSLNKANENGLKVYTVDGARLSEGKTLDFLNVKGDETVVINVTGEKVNWGWTTKYSGANVIWNFEAKSLNIADQDFSGSVLATSAVVNQSREISGSLIARDWVAAETGGVKPLPGKGGGTKIPGVSAPEPTALLTLGGFLGLAAFSRRRHATRL